MRRSEKLLTRKLMTVHLGGERMARQVLLLKRETLYRAYEWVDENHDDITKEELQEGLVDRNLAVWVNASHFDGVRTKLVAL